MVCNKNKKRLSTFNKIFITFYVCLFIFLCLLPIIDIMEPSPKHNSLSEEEVVNYMENIGCKNSTNTYSSEKISFAYNSDVSTCPYNITYLVANNDDYGEELYNEYWELVAVNKKFVAFESDHTISKGTDFRVVVRNNNTIFYLQTNLENENQALEIVKSLGFNTEKNITIIDRIISNLYLVVLFLFIIANMYIWWNLNKKLNRKAWHCIVPIYNILCLSKDVLGKKIYCLLLLIPVASYVFYIILIYNLGKKFNQTTIYTLLMIFIPVIFVPILILDNSKCSQ